MQLVGNFGDLTVLTSDVQLARTLEVDLTSDVQLAKTSEVVMSSSGGKKSSTAIRSAKVLVVAVVMIFGSEGSELLISKEFCGLVGVCQAFREQICL